MTDETPSAPNRDLELVDYLSRRVTTARRRGTRTLVLGVISFVLLVWLGSAATTYLADPERAADALPLHMDRHIQGAIKHELLRSAPSTAQRLGREFSFVPPRLASALHWDLERWATKSAEAIRPHLPQLINEAAMADPEGFEQALAAWEADKDPAPVRAFFDIHLVPLVTEKLFEESGGATAYLVAVAGLVRGLAGDPDLLRPEQLFQRRLLGVTTRVLASQEE